MKINKFFYILFIIFIINISIDNVKAYDKSSCNGEANPCIICSYGINKYFTIDFLVKSNDSNINVSEDYIKESSQAPLMYSVAGINNNDFISNNKIECPNYILYDASSLANDNRLVFSFTRGDVKLSLDNNKSYTSNIDNSSSNSIIPSNNIETSTSSNNTKSNNSKTNNDLGEEVLGCEILGSSFFEYLKSIFFWIQILGPVLALLLSMVDIFIAVASADEDAKKKAVNKVPKRIISAIILILVPYIVELLLSFIDNVNGTTCGL